MKTQIISILLLVVLVGILVIGIEKSRTKLSGEPIKIGAVLPLTGIAAIVGETEKKGIELAVEEINMNGGINGHELQVIFEDDQTDPKNTVSAVTKLATLDKVSAIIGGTWDFLANAAIPVAENNKIVLISPSALPDTLEKQSPYFFVTHAPVRNNVPTVDRFLLDIEGAKVVTMSVNNLWGKAHLSTFKEAIEEDGDDHLVKEVILPNFDGNDIQRELSLIAPLKPDAIIIALNFEDTVSFLKKKQELGVSGKVLADFHVQDNFQKGNLSIDLVKDVTLFVFSNPSSEFIEAYVEEYGENPKTYADTAYDAVYAIKIAMENEGSSDKESVKNGLSSIVGYRGASGVISFNLHNYTENKISIRKIFEGENFVERE